MSRDLVLVKDRSPIQQGSLSGLRAHHQVWCPYCKKNSANMMTGWQGTECIALMRCPDCDHEIRYKQPQDKDRYQFETQFMQNTFDQKVHFELQHFKLIEDERPPIVIDWDSADDEETKLTR